MKKLLLTGLLGLGLFCSCSNEDEPVNNNQQNEGAAYTQIMINVASTSATRTTTPGETGSEVYGDDDEYTIDNIRVVLADPVTNIAKYIYDPDMKVATNADDDDKVIRVTEPFLVEAGDYNVYVLANYKDNQNNLSPIIANSTDMKQAFSITNAAGLATTDKFFMTNSEVSKQTLVTSASGKEVDDAGQTMSSGEAVNLLVIDIERVVSKVTFDNTDNQPFEVMSGNDEIASAELQGVSLINLNKKMYLVKEKDQAVSPTASWSGYFYVKDPNYDKTLTGAADETDWLSANFSQSRAETFVAPNAAKLYCPENTMGNSGVAQQNGQTTGVVYKVKYTPHATKGFSTLANNGTDTYSQIYTKLLAGDSYDTDITETMFTTATGSDGSFYEYNGFIFKTLNAAILYYTIDKAASKTTDDTNIGIINGSFVSNKTSTPADVHTYTDGYCYYTAWIKHNPNGSHMEAGKFGTVRNHWYELTVTAIKGLGYYEPTFEDPKDPDEEAKANIQVEAKIKKWVLVKQNVTLE